MHAWNVLFTAIFHYHWIYIEYQFCRCWGRVSSRFCSHHQFGMDIDCTSLTASYSYSGSFVCTIPNAWRAKPQDLRRAKHYRFDVWGYQFLIAAAFRANSAVQRLLTYGNSDDTTYWTREDGETYATWIRHIVVHGVKVYTTFTCCLHHLDWLCLNC